jgi:hypothetical protein
MNNNGKSTMAKKKKTVATVGKKKIHQYMSKSLHESAAA